MLEPQVGLDTPALEPFFPQRSQVRRVKSASWSIASDAGRWTAITAMATAAWGAPSPPAGAAAAARPPA
eukprot:3427518-Pyramimonas_sp.AAC.1